MIVAHVQARIGSTRLPGKVLRDIVGKPMLWHIVNRLKRSKLIDKIVIVTSTNEEDKAILEFGEKEGIETFAGSEEDLVDRHYQAAKKYKADVIVRITGDCPLVDPKVVDKIIKYFLDGKFDYASNIEKCTYPDGLDVQVLSYSALETIWKKCKKPLERELFSAYIKLHPEKFKIGNVEQEQDLSHMRWTVDYEEDLRFVREVYKRLYKKGEIFYMEDVLQLLKKEPELMDINKGLKSPEGRIEWVLEKTKRESASTKLTKSYKYLEKAKKIIPGGTQTFSKSYNQFPLGVSPIYLQRGKGCYVWDIDNNKYIDYILALAPVILGYSYPRVDKAIKDQLKSGIIFSLPHPLELELAEKLTKIIPCCEMVRFGKNGSDATSGAIRVARAFTGRDKIACCGYHGWQDWYICSTTRDKGIPKSIHNLTYTFKYNNIESLEKIFDENKNELAAVILEPISTIEPKNNFLKKVKKITHENDAILIFDEIVTGFRLAVGGAQEYYNVIPDLACLGKSMANGMPLSAIVGKEEIMKEFEEVFCSFTFGGECLSLAASIATIDEIIEKNVIAHLWKQGNKIMDELNKLITQYNLETYMECYGLGPRNIIKFKDKNGKEDLILKTLFLQEVIKRGILSGGYHNMCYSHTTDDLKKTINVYTEALSVIKKAIEEGDIKKYLEAEIVRPVFREI